MYSKEEILEMFKNTRPYQKDCVNYKGKAKNGDYYTEIIARKILDDNDSFKIEPYFENIKDVFCYKKRNDFGIDVKSEKGLCRYWYNNGFDEDIKSELGIPIEYELNIVEKLKINVDLVSYKDGILYLIEVKGRISDNNKYYYSSETLLRCALEIKTYYESLKNKKNEIFEGIKKSKRNKEIVVGSNVDEIRMAILVPDGSVAAEQYKNKDFPNINELISKWNIEVLVFKNTKIKD